MQEIKRQLRKKIKQERDQLGAEYCRRSDSAIMKHIRSLTEYRNATTIFCYVSRGSEIDTFPILEAALEEQKRVCVPRCEGQGLMDAYQIQSIQDLQPGKFGILEPPKSCVCIAPKEIDLALIPCLTCDYEGNRLGYGGGYYDRYLKRWDFLKIVLCRSRTMTETVPHEETDCRMDIIVTENGVIRSEKGLNCVN